MNGQCFCGDIKYQINGEILYGEACHCRICQQLSGGPFQIWLKCNAESLIVQGTVKNYHSSENVIRQSCGNCGSHLFFKYLDRTDQIYITATSLDNPNSVKPNMHIWIQRKLSWLHLNDGIPTEET
ncbi:MAG: GFA family protein [Pseudobdellovibrionaceae bacterium]